MASKKFFTNESLATLIDEIKTYVNNAVSKKANSSHTHTIANVTNLQSTLDGKAASSHSHSAATTSAAGFMSKDDKAKLDKITADADSVSFNRNLTSGTKIGTITINGTGTDLYAPTNTDTHYTTGLKVGASSTATANASATNGNVHLNILDNSTIRDSHKIVGTGATTVTSDANGVITINSTDNNTTYGEAGSSLGLVKTGGDVTISSGVITVNDDSHNHTISNVDNLQSALDGKQATINGGATTITSSNLTTNRVLISNSSGKVAVSAVTSTELGYLDGVTSNIQTQLDGKASSSHTHNYAGSSSAGGAATSANKVNSSLTVQLNGGTTEGTNKFTFDGSGAKSVNITPSDIGAAASSHSHDYLPLTGGTISGVITTTDGAVANRNVTTSGTYYYGGTGFDDGAFLGLYGKDQSNYKGQFRLKADNGEAFVYLEGFPSGQLRWNNKTVATLGTNSALAIADGGTGMRSDPSMLVNLASTSAAGVFATSPRPGVTGTLGIANGGTGATTAPNARTNLGFTYGTAEPSGTPETGEGSVYFRTGGDAVIEAGTKDMWTFQKWASGIAECWGRCVLPASSTPELKLTLPFDFASTSYVVNLTPGHNGGTVIRPISECTYAGANSTRTVNSFYISATLSGAYNVYVEVNVKGRWK